MIGLRKRYEEDPRFVKRGKSYKLTAVYRCSMMLSRFRRFEVKINVITDEQAIRNLVETWMRATAEGDFLHVLSLMSEDVVFLSPGRPPMRGRDAFAAASQAMSGSVRIMGTSDIQEIQIEGSLAYCWSQLSVKVVTVTGEPLKRLSGSVLSVLRKNSEGAWQVIRDANMLTPEAG